ncbi:restriction endonuclease subunit S [Bacillus pumilus]
MNKKTIEELLEEAVVPKEEQTYEVPENWVYFKFTSIFDVQGGTQPPKSQFVDEEREGYVRLVQIRDFSSDKYKTYIPNTQKLRKMKEEDILIARYGASIGRILTGLSGAYNVALAKVVYPKGKVDKKFLFWLLKSEHFQIPLMGISRSAQSGFNKNDLSYFKMPLPPLNEQKRITEKVERLLSKVDEAEQLIKEAQETFELRRAAILDMTFRGELTVKWRNNSISVTPIDETLEKIKIVKRNLKNKITKIDELNEFPFAIPESWKWIKLDEICLSLKNGLYKPASYYSDIGTPCLRMYNIDNSELNLKDIHYMTLTNEEIEEYGLKYGDILINRVNSRELVGKCASVPKDFPTSVFESKNIRIRLHEEISAEFVSGFLNSIYVKKWINESCKQTVGMATINQEFLKNLLIPLPPVEEQKQIMSILNHILFNENKLKDTLSLSKKLDVLKESILSKAFRGELGTNDPSEESAIELLKKVLQEQVK